MYFGGIGNPLVFSEKPHDYMTSFGRELLGFERELELFEREFLRFRWGRVIRV
jgi:hypothetical protein